MLVRDTRAALARIGIAVARRPSARQAKFQWSDDFGRRAVYMPPRWWFEPGDYAKCLVHEAIHAAGYVMGTLRTADWSAAFLDSSASEERIAEWGSQIVGVWYGLEPKAWSWTMELGWLTPDEFDEVISRLVFLGLEAPQD